MRAWKRLMACHSLGMSFDAGKLDRDELAGTISTRAPSCTARNGSMGCHMSLQMRIAMPPNQGVDARSAWPGLKSLRSSKMS